jgi:hypothetical protein
LKPGFGPSLFCFFSKIKKSIDKHVSFIRFFWFVFVTLTVCAVQLCGAPGGEGGAGDDEGRAGAEWVRPGQSEEPSGALYG